MMKMKIDYNEDKLENKAFINSSFGTRSFEICMSQSAKFLLQCKILNINEIKKSDSGSTKVSYVVHTGNINNIDIMFFWEGMV